MTNPSASSLERATQCPASFALHQARHTGEAALKGTSNHEVIEGELVRGDASKHEVVRRAVEGALSLAVEESYAIDVEAETVRRLGERLGRRYGKLSDSEIALTLDLRVISPQGWSVWDWKSRERVTPARDNLQIRAACVALLKYEGLGKIQGGIGYLDNDETDTHTFDQFDVPTFFEDMRHMLRRIRETRAIVGEGKTPDVSSGPWCKYCPSLPYCPAHTRLAMQMMGELDYVSNEIAVFTPEQVSKAWDTVKRLETMMERAKDSLRLRISQSFIPRPNNKRLAIVECRRSSFDAAKAKARLSELGEDINEFTKTTTYDQVKEINVK